MKRFFFLAKQEKRHLLKQRHTHTHKTTKAKKEELKIAREVIITVCVILKITFLRSTN